MTRAKRGPRASTQEPDLIPIMNLVCLLIPFLLLTATFVQYASIEATAPRPNPMTPASTPVDPPLNLSVLVTDAGFTVTARGVVLSRTGPSVDETRSSGPTIGLASGPGGPGYDFQELTSLLRDIKNDNESESGIFIGAERNVKYETIVRVMDATREDDEGELFPRVTMLGGVM